MSSSVGEWIEPQQGCNCDDDDIWCNNLNLTSIPPILDRDHVDLLDLDYNSITTLSSNSLPANIRQLSITNNPVTAVDDSFFDPCVSSLQYLSFSQAKFTRVPNAVGRLQQLRTLNIADTEIQDWNPDTMLKIAPSVNELTLDNCSITYWPAWIANFNNLTRVSLAYNFIPNIPDTGLASFDTLISLNLVANNLTLVPKIFSKFSALQMLYLKQNRITDVTWLPPLSKLTTLSLNFNQISDSNTLSKALEPYAKSLQHLSIDSNRLTSIPDLSFLAGIGSCDFSDNRISDSTSGSLPKNMFVVKFDSNYLQHIPRALMTSMSVTSIVINQNSLPQITDYEFPHWATDAQLQSNLITELTDTSFPANCSLWNLDLSFNPITKISTRAFQNVPNLFYLNIRSTKLTRIPVGLLSAVGLQGVDLTDSTYLVCTCQEKKLVPWIESRTADNVMGSCGRTSIYEFYSIYAADCP